MQVDDDQAASGDQDQLMLVRFRLLSDCVGTDARA